MSLERERAEFAERFESQVRALEIQLLINTPHMITPADLFLALKDEGHEVVHSASYYRYGPKNERTLYTDFELVQAIKSGEIKASKEMKLMATRCTVSKAFASQRKDNPSARRSSAMGRPGYYSQMANPSRKTNHSATTSSSDEQKQKRVKRATKPPQPRQPSKQGTRRLHQIPGRAAGGRKPVSRKSGGGGSKDTETTKEKNGKMAKQIAQLSQTVRELQARIANPNPVTGNAMCISHVDVYKLFGRDEFVCTADGNIYIISGDVKFVEGSHGHARTSVQYKAQKLNEADDGWAIEAEYQMIDQAAIEYSVAAGTASALKERGCFASSDRVVTLKEEHDGISMGPRSLQVIHARYRLTLKVQSAVPPVEVKANNGAAGQNNQRAQFIADKKARHLELILSKEEAKTLELDFARAGIKGSMTTRCINHALQHIELVAGASAGEGRSLAVHGSIGGQKSVRTCISYDIGVSSLAKLDEIFCGKQNISWRSGPRRGCPAGDVGCLMKAEFQVIYLDSTAKLFLKPTWCSMASTADPVVVFRILDDCRQEAATTAAAHDL